MSPEQVRHTQPVLSGTEKSTRETSGKRILLSPASQGKRGREQPDSGAFAPTPAAGNERSRHGIVSRGFQTFPPSLAIVTTARKITTKTTTTTKRRRFPASPWNKKTGKKEGKPLELEEISLCQAEGNSSARFVPPDPEHPPGCRSSWDRSGLPQLHPLPHAGPSGSFPASSCGLQFSC